jgi:hypothetical protein
MLKRMLAVVAVVGIVIGSLGVAAAEDVTGKVQAVNASERSFTLEDGTQIFLAEGLSPEAVKEGAKVKVTYEEREGKKIATAVEEMKD